MASASFTPQLIAYYKAHADDTLQPQEIATGVVGLVIAYSAVLARAFTRRVSGPKFGLDDWFIIASLVPLTGYAVCIFYSISIGDGRHMIYLTNPAGYVIAYIAQLICYSVAIALIKISILLFYRRIFPSKTLFVLSCALGAIVIAYNIAIILVTTLQCIPLQDLWTTWGAEGHCIGTTVPYAIISIVNVITDFLILALPVKYVWHLQMRFTRKLQILFMFLLGSIACVFGVVRVWSVATIAPVDQSWNDVYPEIWSFVEISIGVLAACLPTLGMLVKKNKTKSSQQKYSHTPTRSSVWAKRRRSRTLDRSATDIGTSNWSKSYGAWSPDASQDHDHDLETGTAHTFEGLDDQVENEAGRKYPGAIHVKQELFQSTNSYKV